jgi:c-di-GMP-binding flagellar brake protein YcgR
MLPKVNAILFLQVASLDEAESQEEHKARIADINAEQITMEIPINVKTGRFKRLYSGDQLSIYYLTEGGVKNYFNSEVIGFSEAEAIRLVLIKSPEPEQITKVQRRSFLRVPAELEIAVKLQNKLQITAITDDVGGGGVSFICDGHVPIKDKEIVTCWLLLNFKNGSIDHMPFSAQVVRIKSLETGKQLIMCSYVEIADHERQKVIRYCFERQLDFRKK